MILRMYWSSIHTLTFSSFTFAFFSFDPAFSAFVFVPEFLVFSLYVFSELLSALLFVLLPAFLFRFTFCGADHSSKSFTTPQYFLQFKHQAQTVMCF